MRNLTKRLLLEVYDDKHVEVTGFGWGDELPSVMIFATKALVTQEPWLITTEPWRLNELGFMLNVTWDLASKVSVPDEEEQNNDES